MGPGQVFMYGLYKVHVQEVDGCPPFRLILSVLQTLTYKLAKFLVPKLNTSTKNEYTVKDSLHKSTRKLPINNEGSCSQRMWARTFITNG